MQQVLVFLINGFEEIEALTSIDVLRRGDVAVTTVSLEAQRTVVGAHAVPVVADILFDQIDLAQVQMLLLPGGTVQINEHQGLRQLVAEFAANGGKVAAICAAPMLLGGLGLLKGKQATCYPSFEPYLIDAELKTEQAVVVDANIITGKGPALSMEFALTVLEQLTSAAKRAEVAAGLLYNEK